MTVIVQHENGTTEVARGSRISYDEGYLVVLSESGDVITIFAPGKWDSGHVTLPAERAVPLVVQEITAELRGRKFIDPDGWTLEHVEGTKWRATHPRNLFKPTYNEPFGKLWGANLVEVTS